MISISRSSTSRGSRYPGSAKRNMPPGSRVRFVHHHLVPEQRKIERRGQPGRARADHRDRFPGRRSSLGDDLGRHGIEPIRQQDRIGDHAMHLPHVDRLVHGLPAAPALARMLADTAGRGRQRVVHDDRFERIRQTRPPCRAAGSAECSCASDNCSRKVPVPDPGKRRRGSAWRGCGPRTRGGNGAARSAPNSAPTGRARRARCRGSSGPVRPVRRDPPRALRLW